jgi:hypothetical protein
MNPDGTPYQQPQGPQPQQPAQPTGYGQAPQSTSQQPTHYFINQELKMGRESFAITDGQNLVCVAKRKIMAVKEHMDVYRDEAATQLVFTIQQERAMAMSKVYDVVSADGQKMGGFKLEAMQSMMKEHWDILDVNDNPVGVIDQDTNTAMAGKAVDMIGGALGGLFGGGGGAMGGMAAGNGVGSMIPQTFVASINNQPVCRYHEQMNIGMLFKMDIDFSSDTAGVFDRTLGIAGAILLASKHMSQDN